MDNYARKNVRTLCTPLHHHEHLGQVTKGKLVSWSQAVNTKYWLSSVCLTSTTTDIHGMRLNFSSLSDFIDFALAGDLDFCSLISSVESNIVLCSYTGINVKLCCPEHCKMVIFLIILVKTQFKLDTTIVHCSISALRRLWSTSETIHLIKSPYLNTQDRYSNYLLSFGLKYVFSRLPISFISAAFLQTSPSRTQCVQT